MVAGGAPAVLALPPPPTPGCAGSATAAGGVASGAAGVPVGAVFPIAKKGAT